MNKLQIFNYGAIPVRTIMKKGEPWWVLSDVCQVLRLGSPHKVADRLDCDEKGRNQIPTPGGNQQMTIINESGLYSVILRSDKPEAKQFKRWVTHEVLPAIRKTGTYSTVKVKTPSVKEIVELCRFTRAEMEERGATPEETSKAVKDIADNYGVYLPDFFVRPETMTMQVVYDMIDFVCAHERGRGKRIPTYEDYIAYKSSMKQLL